MTTIISKNVAPFLLDRFSDFSIKNLSAYFQNILNYDIYLYHTHTTDSYRILPCPSNMWLLKTGYSSCTPTKKFPWIHSRGSKTVGFTHSNWGFVKMITLCIMLIYTASSQLGHFQNVAIAVSLISLKLEHTWLHHLLPPSKFWKIHEFDLLCNDNLLLFKVRLPFILFLTWLHISAYGLFLHLFYTHGD